MSSNLKEHYYKVSMQSNDKSKFFPPFNHEISFMRSLQTVNVHALSERSVCTTEKQQQNMDLYKNYLDPTSVGSSIN